MAILDLLKKVSEELQKVQNGLVDGICELCESDFSTDDPEPPPPSIIIINLNVDSTDDPEPPPSVSFSTDDPEPPPGKPYNG